MYVLALLHSFDKFVQDIFLADKLVSYFPFASGTINKIWLAESKRPPQSGRLNTQIWIPFWEGPLHLSKCRKKLVLIYFIAL